MTIDLFKLVQKCISYLQVDKTPNNNDTLSHQELTRADYSSHQEQTREDNSSHQELTRKDNSSHHGRTKEGRSIPHVQTKEDNFIPHEQTREDNSILSAILEQQITNKFAGIESTANVHEHVALGQIESETISDSRQKNGDMSMQVNELLNTARFS